MDQQTDIRTYRAELHLESSLKIFAGPLPDTGGQ